MCSPEETFLVTKFQTLLPQPSLKAEAQVLGKNWKKERNSKKFFSIFENSFKGTRKTFSVFSPKKNIFFRLTKKCKRPPSFFLLQWLKWSGKFDIFNSHAVTQRKWLPCLLMLLIKANFNYITKFYEYFQGSSEQLILDYYFSNNFFFTVESWLTLSKNVYFAS